MIYLPRFYLFTVEVLYHLPDHQSLLQEFIWQTIDEDPDRPRIQRFLRYWDTALQGPIHSVKLAKSKL